MLPEKTKKGQIHADRRALTWKKEKKERTDVTKDNLFLKQQEKETRCAKEKRRRDRD